MSSPDEPIFEDVLGWFEDLGFTVAHGPHLAPNEPLARRNSFGEVVLVERLREAIWRLNLKIPEAAREEALRKVLRVEPRSFWRSNRAFHETLRDGIDVEFAKLDGSIAEDKVRLVDFTDVHVNDWLMADQVTVVEGAYSHRLDLVLFINGLPLGLIVLKNADAASADAQVQTYLAEIPSLLQYNAALVLSDGVHARIGSLAPHEEWFKVWRTIDGLHEAAPETADLESWVRGLFQRQRFLELLRHIIVSE